MYRRLEYSAYRTFDEGISWPRVLCMHKCGTAVSGYWHHRAVRVLWLLCKKYIYNIIHTCIILDAQYSCKNVCAYVCEGDEQQPPVPKWFVATKNVPHDTAVESTSMTVTGWYGICVVVSSFLGDGGREYKISPPRQNVPLL